MIVNARVEEEHLGHFWRRVDIRNMRRSQRFLRSILANPRLQSFEAA